MNKYDKKVFQSHYGKLYFRIMYWGLGIALLSVQLAYYPSFFGLSISNNIVGLFATLLVTSLIGASIAGYLYFVSMNKAKNQQVWIDKNNVYFRIDKKVKKNMHTYTYRIRNIEEGELQDRYIHVKGSFQLVDEVGNDSRQDRVNEVFIPRCFTNEENVTRLLRIA